MPPEQLPSSLARFLSDIEELGKVADAHEYQTYCTSRAAFLTPQVLSNNQRQLLLQSGMTKAFSAAAAKGLSLLTPLLPSISSSPRTQDLLPVVYGVMVTLHYWCDKLDECEEHVVIQVCNEVLSTGEGGAVDGGRSCFLLGIPTKGTPGHQHNVSVP